MMNYEYYQQLEVDTKAIVTGLDSVLSEIEKAEVLQFVVVGEYGVALETLCGVLVDRGYVVTREVFGNIEKLGTAMGIDPIFWREIKIDCES